MKATNNPNINPYKTSYGKMIKIVDIEKKLTEYINSMHGLEIEKMGYDVNLFGITPIIITGRTAKEKSIPPFNYPIYIETYTGIKCIAVNLTEYLRPQRVKEHLENKFDSKYEDLEACCVHTPSMECMLGVAKVMAARLTGEDYNIDLLWKQLASVYGSILVNLFNSSISKLGVIEEMNVKSVGKIYYYLKLKGLENVRTDHLVNVLDDENSKEVLKTDMITTLQMSGNPLSNRMLTEVVRAVIDPAKAHITLDTSLFNNIKGDWFGLKGSGLISMMMECDSLYIPIVYYALSDKSFSKSKISMMLSKTVKRDVSSKIIDTLSTFFKPKN